jgi:hypothetical protein
MSRGITIPPYKRVPRSEARRVKQLRGWMGILSRRPKIDEDSVASRFHAVLHPVLELLQVAFAPWTITGHFLARKAGVYALSVIFHIFIGGEIDSICLHRLDVIRSEERADINREAQSTAGSRCLGKGLTGWRNGPVLLLSKAQEDHHTEDPLYGSGEPQDNSIDTS